MKSNKAFTLIELLITIAIIAILGSATVLVLNPVEMMSQARDSQRVNDLGVIKKAVDLSIFNNSSITTGTAQRVYLSLPSATAPACDALGLPALPSGWQYVCSSATNLTKIDGTGWLPIDFSSTNTPAITSLPIDPQNNASFTKYYSYISGGSYVLTSLLESEKHSKQAANDGGTDPGRIEIGSDLSLWTTASNLQGYWKFDEGSGSQVFPTPVGLTGNIFEALWVTGKSSYGIRFDNSNDKIDLVSPVILSGAFSISFWGYSNGYGGEPGIGGNQTSYSGATGGRININSATNVVGVWTSAGNNDGVTATSAFPIGQWFHFAITRDSSNLIRIYKNGENVTSGSPAMAGSMDFNRIGDNPDNSGRTAWNGIMDEYLLYTRQLSDSEIKAIYNATK